MHEAGLNIDQDCKVLTIHRSEDEIIPVEDGLEFAKIIANHKLQIIEGADHCYNKHREELVSTVLAFIKENLQRSMEEHIMIVSLYYPWKKIDNQATRYID
ncbi:alpha/beta hydrolase fold protein [Tanacetum coccineum]